MGTFACRVPNHGLYREDEHPEIGLEKCGGLFLSIVPSREHGFGEDLGESAFWAFAEVAIGLWILAP